MARFRQAYVGVEDPEPFNTAKAQEWDINRLWYEWDDPDANEKNLKATRSRGVNVGLKMNGNGAAAADAMHDALNAAGFGSSTGPLTCGAMFDDEDHDPAGVLAMLKRWRQLRPTRYTVWTLEPWQEGWVDDLPELAALINNDPYLVVVVQEYMTILGDQMYPAAAECLDRLVAAGIRRDRLGRFLGIYKGMKFPYGWEGIWWTWGALPASPPTSL